MRIFLLGFFLLVNCCLCLAVEATEPDYVVAVQSIHPDRKVDYVPTVLKMILEASKAPGEVVDIVFTDNHYSQKRWMVEIKNQKINGVMWTVTNKEREQFLRPIRVPLFKDLWGKRVLVIRKEDQEKFANIKNKAQLKKFVAGQGDQWPDTDILISNGLPVVTGVGTENLYNMLKAKRFDYFPRGALELTADASFIAAHDFVVVDNLLLSYVNPLYFFVNKNNAELIRRLEKGWEIIIDNGEFETFFMNSPRVQAAIPVLKSKKTIIELNNPNLPDKTPSDVKYRFKY